MKLSNSEKVFVIGLDGATFYLIKPWADEGRLPNLGKIMEEGAFGELKSTIPTNSAPAWTSFVTGTNPGKHGILHFKSLGYQTTEYLMNRKSRGCKAIWNILSEKGKKVGIINVPLTYPPEKVNGFMISGMDTPGRKSTFTFPEGLYQEIRDAVGDYQIEAQLADLVRIRNDSDRKRFIKAVMNTEELRLMATRYLMERYDWDFLLVVLMAADRIQHRFWKFMDQKHPHYNSKGAKKFGNVVLNVYKRLDEIVGELSEMLDDSTTLVVMSDHGFGPAPVKYIDLNNWLSSEGLLTFKEKSYGAKSFILNKLQLYTPIRLRHYLRAKFRSQVDKIQLASRLNNINWYSTKAYADQHVEIFSSIWVNLKGREPYGIVKPGNQHEELLNQIISLLKELKDPSSGQKMATEVYRREDIFKGSLSIMAPDLIVEWKDSAYRTQSSFLGNKLESYIGTLDSKETSRTISGEHKMNGIFLLSGKGINKGKEIQGANIVDLAPTILFKLGIPIPREMDGKVLKGAFEKAYLESRKMEFSDAKIIYEDTDTHTFSSGENQKVQDRLRALGYLE